MRRRNATDWWTCTKVVPQGVNEPSESNVDLTASQYDTHKDVVGPNEIIRIESYVFDKKKIESYVVGDDSDYEILHVAPPND